MISSQYEQVRAKRFDSVIQYQGIFTADECDHILSLRKDYSKIVNKHLTDLLIYQDMANDDWKVVYSVINKKMKSVLESYNKVFFEKLPMERLSVSHIGFLNDHDGSFTELHYDWEIVKVKLPTPREIVKPFVALLYLTDGMEGGELMFPLQGLQFKPIKGSVIILPCNYTYPHLSMPVIDGEKHVCRITYQIDSQCYEVDELEI